MDQTYKGLFKDCYSSYWLHSVLRKSKIHRRRNSTRKAVNTDTFFT